MRSEDVAAVRRRNWANTKCHFSPIHSKTGKEQEVFYLECHMCQCLMSESRRIPGYDHFQKGVYYLFTAVLDQIHKSKQFARGFAEWRAAQNRKKTAVMTSTSRHWKNCIRSTSDVSVLSGQSLVWHGQRIQNRGRRIQMTNTAGRKLGNTRGVGQGQTISWEQEAGHWLGKGGWYKYWQVIGEWGTGEHVGVRWLVTGIRWTAAQAGKIWWNNWIVLVQLLSTLCLVSPD